MNKKKPGIDIIDKILEACYKHNPDALFIMSLMHQYEERGSLSKKQLEGLYLKAKKVTDLPQNWLATLEAEILKRPTRDKTPAAENKPLYVKEERLEKMLQEILIRYPQHKRVLFLQTKFSNQEAISADEKKEIEKFHKLLIK
jgi:3-hydroxyacyl-CoA dehydrogenase